MRGEKRDRQEQPEFQYGYPHVRGGIIRLGQRVPFIWIISCGEKDMVDSFAFAGTDHLLMRGKRHQNLGIEVEKVDHPHVRGEKADMSAIKVGQKDHPHVRGEKDQREAVVWVISIISTCVGKSVSRTGR